MLYYLSLGSNLGDREQTLRTAVQRLEQIGAVRRCSSLYYSAPWGFESEHDFCNLCCSLETALPPLEVLRATQEIERALGRIRVNESGNEKKGKCRNEKKRKYADRPIDIDLILVFDKEKEIFMATPELTIPHPLWQERDFVKEPLAEIMH